MGKKRGFLSNSDFGSKFIQTLHMQAILDHWSYAPRKKGLFRKPEINRIRMMKFFASGCIGKPTVSAFSVGWRSGGDDLRGISGSRSYDVVLNLTRTTPFSGGEVLWRELGGAVIPDSQSHGNFGAPANQDHLFLQQQPQFHHQGLQFSNISTSSASYSRLLLCNRRRSPSHSTSISRWLLTSISTRWWRN